jgi:hypothetical protein
MTVAPRCDASAVIHGDQVTHRTAGFGGVAVGADELPPHAATVATPQCSDLNRAGHSNDVGTPSSKLDQSDVDLIVAERHFAIVPL